MKVSVAASVSRPARVEMIPLLDVVFLLIVFFIYAFVTMTVHRGLPVELPEAATSVLDRSDYLAVTVERDGTVFVGKQAVPFDALATAVRAAGQPSDDVYVAADRDTRHADVVRVLNTLRAEGFTKISIETQLPAGGLREDAPSP